MGQMDGIDVTACERCEELCESRTRIVNGTGPATADLLFVGEGPGANEDEQGEPFVGRSGDVLDDTLHEVGLDRGDVRITNCVRCRPPENRDPTAGELENCRRYLHDEITHVDPEVIVTLGKVPSEHLLDRDVGVTDEAGEMYDVTIDGEPQRLLVCVHPAATLYDRSQEDTFEAAMTRAAEFAIDESGQSRIGDY